MDGWVSFEGHNEVAADIDAFSQPLSDARFQDYVPPPLPTSLNDEPIGAKIPIDVTTVPLSRAWNASNVVHPSKTPAPTTFDDGSFGLGLGFVRDAKFQSATQYSSPRASPQLSPRTSPRGVVNDETGPPPTAGDVIAAASAVIEDGNASQPPSSRYTAEIQDVSPSELASEQGVVDTPTHQEDDWAKFD